MTGDRHSRPSFVILTSAAPDETIAEERSKLR